MDKANVTEILNKTQELLDAGPRSRDSVRRLMRTKGYGTEDIEAALDRTDWTAQAVAVAQSLPQDLNLSPQYLTRRLFIAGFTASETSAALSSINWADRMSAAMEPLYAQGISRSSARGWLGRQGYQQEDIDAVLGRCDGHFWEQQACRFLNRWVADWTSRDEFRPGLFLKEAGFTDAEIAYATAHMEPDLDEIVLREAQDMYEAGIVEVGIEIALEYAGIAPDVAAKAISRIDRSGKSVLDRRVERYMAQSGPRTEAQLREMLGNLTVRGLQDLYERHGINSVDWDELNRESALNLLADHRQGRLSAENRLRQSGYSESVVHAVLSDVDWQSRAVQMTQALAESMRAFTEAEISALLRSEGFTDDEAAAALDQFQFPSDKPDPVAGTLRRLYTEPVLLATAVENTARLLGVASSEVAQTAQELGLDWEEPVRQYAQSYFSEMPDDAVAATPAGLRRYLEEAFGAVPDDSVLDSIDCDWEAEAVRLIKRLKENFVPDLIVLSELRKGGFPHDVREAAAAATGLEEAFSSDHAAMHLQALLSASNLALPTIRAELEVLGFTPEMIEQAEQEMEAVLTGIDWKQRALAWIREEGAENGLSQSEIRTMLAQQGCSKQEAAWAMDHDDTDYTQNAIRRAMHILQSGGRIEKLPAMLRSAGFTAAETTQAVNTFQK